MEHEAVLDKTAIVTFDDRPVGWFFGLARETVPGPAALADRPDRRAMELLANRIALGMNIDLTI